ncbi:ABC transporter permease [Paraconexibacter sp.]|uniref:ABC transporter permease n=1 Tax=Paraconexibacter sp. TaxID=2949640 RepID=UPI003567C268
MSDLISANMLVLRRRRGLWWSALAIPSSLIVLMTVLASTDVIDLDGGRQFVEDSTLVLGFFLTLLAVLVGARLGSEERATGTLRYQLLTGVPRSRLFVAKLGALVTAGLAMTTVAIAVTTVSSFVVPVGASETTGAGDVVSAAWGVLLPALVYGSLAFGVGVLLGSTGPAITVALVLNLIGIDLLYALTLIDDWFRHLVLDIGVDRLTVDEADDDTRVSLGAAIVMVLAWVGSFLGAGWMRLRTLEA